MQKLEHFLICCVCLLSLICYLEAVAKWVNGGTTVGFLIVHVSHSTDGWIGLRRKLPVCHRKISFTVLYIGPTL